MNDIELIASRKRELVERSETQRKEITRIYYSWQARTLATRQVAAVLKNPLVLSTIGLVLLKLPWTRLYRLGGWAWKGWRFMQMLRRIRI